jgi:hypothetical protein
LLAAGLLLAALTLWSLRQERRAAAAAAHRAEDTARLDALLGARTALETSVLETRAGLQRNFDAMNRAILSLRGAARDAALVRGRGPGYAVAAEALDRLADDMRSEERALESLKTDLALLRLSTRDFPSVAEAIARATDPSGGVAQRQLTLPSEAARRQLASLQSDVERYQDFPARDVALRLETQIAALDANHGSFPEAAQSELDVLLGHARSILDRRERVDRLTRSVARSPARLDAEQARSAYERAARREIVTAWVMRVTAAWSGATALVLLALGGWARWRAIHV